MTGAGPIHDAGGWMVTLSPVSVLISIGMGGISKNSFTLSAAETTTGKCYITEWKKRLFSAFLANKIKWKFYLVLL